MLEVEEAEALGAGTEVRGAGCWGARRRELGRRSTAGSARRAAWAVDLPSPLRSRALSPRPGRAGKRDSR